MTVTKFGVPCPEIGPDAKLDFTFESFEALQSELGENYISILAEGLDRRDTKIIVQALSRAVSGNASPHENLLSVLPITEITGRLADALWLRLYGRPARVTRL